MKETIRRYCESSDWSRRRFIQRLGGALLVPNIITSFSLAQESPASPSKKLTMLAIGVGNIGIIDLNIFLSDPRVQVVAVCDVRPSHLQKAKSTVDKKYGNQDCKTYVDYREAISRDDIDIVMCATPDHWHAQISIDAMKAGKDVYCEKPLTLTIGEGRKMVDVARQYGRVLSCGSQRVIGDYGGITLAARSGLYGKIVEGRCYPGWGRHPRLCTLPEEALPENTIDWDMWLGPAPWVPYNSLRCDGTYDQNKLGFRDWSDYAGGRFLDWGGHDFGGLMHAMGVDHTGPTEIIPRDEVNKSPLTYVFSNGMKILIQGGYGIRCEDGWAIPVPNLSVPPGLRWYQDGENYTIGDFIKCVRNRMKPFQDVEYAHRIATVGHLGNICHLLNRKLMWDPVKEDFINDPEASRLIDRPRRGPWQI